MDCIALAALGFSFTYALIAWLLAKAPKAVPVHHKKLPRVAVLVAMRNEEAYISDCLSSLTRQTYPSRLYDVFVLDDRSEDHSPEIAAQFSNQFEHIHLIPITEDKHGLHGKMNALAQGIRQVDHELILITDADCVVPESWIEGMVDYFDSQTGMVGALTVLFPFNALRIAKPATNLWARIQALDWIFLQALAAANSNFGKPITILGNNFAFRRAAYLQVGGFEKLGFSVTEDFALMEAVRKRTAYKIRHTIDIKNAIYSHPVASVADFFRQRLRWVHGGKKARPWGIFILSFSVIAHLIVLLSFLAAPLNWAVWAALGIFCLTDALILHPVLKKLKLQKLWLTFPAFEGFYWAYLLIFSVLYFLPLKVRWKGRAFKEN